MRKSYDKYIIKNVNRLYHLSESDLSNKTLRPRVPYSICMDINGEYFEDRRTARVCLSSTMSGAFRAISFDGSTEELYVHELDNKDQLLKDKKLIKPTEDMVYDCKFTNEYWSVGKTKLKCIGKARFSYELPVPYYLWRPKVKIEWIEKYDENIQ